MSDKISWYGIGHVKDAHSLTGELFVVVYSKEISWLPNLKTAKLVNPKTELETILEIERSRSHKNGFIIKAKEINDRTQAEAVKKYKFEISRDLLISEEGEGLYLTEVLGFKLYSQENEELGEIVDFSGSSYQDLAVVQAKDFQFEIPFVDDFIQEIIYEDKKVIMNIPEGLIDLAKENTKQVNQKK